MSLRDMGITPREGTLQAEIERLRIELQDHKQATLNAALELQQLRDIATAVDKQNKAEIERLRELLRQRGGGDGKAIDSMGDGLVAQAKEIERLQKVVADHALTIGTLRDTNTTLRLDLEEALKPKELFRAGWDDGIARLEKCGQEIDKLREETQTARLALDVALKEAAELREKIDGVGNVMSIHGCLCACACDGTGHQEDCDLCWTCEVHDVLWPKPGAAP